MATFKVKCVCWCLVLVRMTRCTRGSRGGGGQRVAHVNVWHMRDTVIVNDHLYRHYVSKYALHVSIGFQTCHR